MPDQNTEHGLRVQLATALRERDDYLARAVNAEKRVEDVQALRERQDIELAVLRLNITQFERVCEAWNAQAVALRADVKRLRLALEAISEAPLPEALDGEEALRILARAALATGGDRG